MDKQLIAISSMAMDLKRVALSLHRDSRQVAKTFADEALKRSEEIDMKSVPEYIKNLLEKTQLQIADLSAERTAEDMLMYSTRLQNYVISKQ